MEKENETPRNGIMWWPSMFSVVAEHLKFKIWTIIFFLLLLLLSSTRSANLCRKTSLPNKRRRDFLGRGRGDGRPCGVPLALWRLELGQSLLQEHHQEIRQARQVRGSARRIESTVLFVFANAHPISPLLFDAGTMWWWSCSEGGAPPPLTCSRCGFRGR